MNLRDFRQSGHWPTLFCAFLYFDLSFMVWVMLGALANFISADFGLSVSQKGLLVALPLLSGAMLRLVLGFLADSIGPRRTGIMGLTLTLVPLCLAWLWADSYETLLLVGCLLGVAGASFAVALPLASRWYPPQHQGLAMGIAGAGNSGTALATLFGPKLAENFGWHAVFGLAMVPIAVTLVVFVLFARNSPTQPAPRRLGDYLALLRLSDTWHFCFFYAITFGGFVGLASFLSIFFYEQYGVSRVTAGIMVTFCVMAGSCLRPVGGHLADRIGGIRMLTMLYVAAALLMLDLATLPPVAWGTTLFIGVMGLLGLGNGAVFQLVPLRFSKEVGMITGIVGAAGGIGGFFLPNLLSIVKQSTGSYSGGLLGCALVCLGGMVMLVRVSRTWEGTFVGQGGRASVETSAASAGEEFGEAGLAGAASQQA